MGCPLCSAAASRPSWLGALRYDGREYPYIECASCRSLYAQRMPDTETLTRMYGPEYGSIASDGHDLDDPKEPQRVVAWLAERPAGTFVDYGCGPGRLLADVDRTGWRAIGVEFDPAVAAATGQRVGVLVANRFTMDALIAEQQADVLHLGDVIEHLTDSDAEMPRILRLLKPGGYLIAQGPLEANTTFFTTLLKLSRRLRQSRVSEMPPYHVMLATAQGQRAFFQRFGLRPIEFSLHEVAWPAPSRIRASDLIRPRALALFTLRRFSQALSAMQPNRWGNRYFYVGQRA